MAGRESKTQGGRSGFFQDDSQLHKLCHDGNMKRISKFVDPMDVQDLAEKMANRKGVFGYTPLHEAVASGKSEVLDYLLHKTNNAHVNCRANSGYTPLHLAASSGHGECVRTLLRHGADIGITDEYGKTPKQTAELSSKGSIVRLLRSEEIIKEVETDGEKLTELLRHGTDSLEPNCLNRALIAATKNDNHYNIGKLIVKGATNLEECLQLAKETKKPQARAMILMVKAAQTGNKAIVQKLFGETALGLENPRDYADDGFADVQKAVLTGKVSTVVPIEIARRNGQAPVREELLLKTDVNQEEGYVYWHGLRLLHLDISWLRKIHWVKKLRLARNGFKSLPNEMGTYLKQVVKVDLQHNELSTIPRCLLELPSLVELNLSHNKLVELPDVPEWSACLTVLDLSRNQLSSLPLNVIAPAIRSLNLSFNHFRAVPLCICSFTTLHSLNLSDNPDILSLPAEMGRLTFLTRLHLNNLKDLNDPPKNLQRETRDCIRYLNSKLRCAKGFFRMKLMLVGCANRGKTTLVARLQGKDCGDESTVGVDVSEWWFKPSLGRKHFHFSIWDFGGQEEYYATHQCFLSQRSLYLLLFNLTHGDKGIQELKPWLNNIALRAPRSCVVIVGTHLDEIKEEEREEVDALLQRVGNLAQSYNNKLNIVEVMPVGLKNCIENIGLLKEAIYNHAANYKTRGGQLIMGQKIPASYHALDKHLELIQQQVRQGNREPIMHAEEFKTMVQQMSLADIQDDDELKTATLFLTDVGSLLHYDDRSHNLHELYFIDPRWLCDMMSKVVTIKERNPFVKKGILYSKDIPLLFKDNRFPWQYFEQYLTLLDRFEIALPLDNRRVLIPSMLPEERPMKFPDEDPETKKPVYSRFIMFSSANTPPGFWSRLLSRIMHSVPQTCFALDKITPASLEQETPVQPSMNDLSFSMAPAAQLQTPMGNEGPPFYEPSDPSDNFEDISTPTISGPIPYINTQQTISAPKVFPNFPESLPLHMKESFKINDIQLEYWRTGLYYCDPDIMFRIESLSGCKTFHKEQKDGVLIVASPNPAGKKIIGQLVDLVVALVNEWYPGLQEGVHGVSNGLEQKVPCFECVKQGRAKPFEFKVEQCLSVIARSETVMQCGYFRNEESKNHEVALVDIVPDLLLQDIDPEFILKQEDIDYSEDDASLLGKGGYGKVYRGKCQGKSVAIKKYLTRSEEAFSELRSEAKLLQQSHHHPCLVCLVGVCVHPIMALVLEEAPLKSLEFPILKKKQPVHRLTIFRIAAEVAAALRFLHNQGIIFRDLKAANVLLWTLDPDSLCHCKLTDFGIATHLAPVGARGLQGTKGFIAPEVLHIGKRKQRSVYDHKADIFSFGMFLYQLIARRHPYHDIPPHRIDVAVEQGERPRLQDVDLSHTGYHYLTQVMKTCWADNPQKRPTTDDIIKKVCLSPVQSVMCIAPIKSKLSLRHAIAITPTNFTQAGQPQRLNSELWVCCDGAEGAEVNMFNTHTMVKVNKNFIKDNQIQCIALCGDHIWVGSRAGIEYGVIDIFSIANRDLVHNIRMRENSVSCITSTERAVYLGTLEGYCFCFLNDIEKIRANYKPRYKYISEHAVDGIAATQQCVWVSHTRYLYFLNFDNLTLEGSIHREKEREAYIGQLSPSPDGNIIWSAHLGGTILSAWDAHQKIHSYDVDTSKHLQRISGLTSENDLVITAMTPALDCVWVGMASGHVMVFHKDELLAWYQPYKEYVRFLTCIPCSGVCEMEKSIVASGGKKFQSMVDDMGPDYEKVDDKGVPIDKAGIVVLWEAYTSKTMKQIKLVEENSPGFLDDHHSVHRTIINGEFKDGTHILNNKVETDPVPYTPDLDALPNYDTLNLSVSVNTPISSNLNDSYTMGGKQYDSLRSRDTNFMASTSTSEAASSRFDSGIPPSIPEVGSFDQDLESPKPAIFRPRMRTATVVADVFTVNIHDSSLTVRISCPKPAKLKVLLSELQVNTNVDEADCQLEYQRNETECVRIRTQEEFEKYLLLPNKPQLWLAKPAK